MTERETDLDGMEGRGAETTRGLADATRDSVARATEYARTQVDRMSERAGDLAEDAGTTVDKWSAHASSYLRSHPLRTLAITAAMGYVLGRVFWRD